MGEGAVTDQIIGFAAILRSIREHADQLANDGEHLFQLGFALVSIGAAIIADAKGSSSARQALRSLAALTAETGAEDEGDDWSASDDDFEDFDDE